MSKKVKLRERQKNTECRRFQELKGTNSSNAVYSLLILKGEKKKEEGRKTGRGGKKEIID